MRLSLVEPLWWLEPTVVNPITHDNQPSLNLLLRDYSYQNSK